MSQSRNVDPFGSVWLRLERRERDRALQIIAAVREPAGPQVELMIEGHGRFDVPTAIGLAQEMVPFRPTWFEEPIPPEAI